MKIYFYSERNVRTTYSHKTDKNRDPAQHFIKKPSHILALKIQRPRHRLLKNCLNNISFLHDKIISAHIHLHVLNKAKYGVTFRNQQNWKKDKTQLVRAFH
jgi:hypothetical protein